MGLVESRRQCASTRLGCFSWTSTRRWSTIVMAQENGLAGSFWDKYKKGF